MTTMNPGQVRDLIHSAARSCTHPHLDTAVFVRDNVSHVEFAALMCHPERMDVYIDIPLTSVVALQHNNVVPTSVAARTSAEVLYTWRQWALALHMSDWMLDVFDYFEGEIRDKTLPTFDGTSRRGLDLSCYGGVTFCDNGAHRLAAAMAWLLHKDGCAQLRKARVSLRLPNDGLLDSLASVTQPSRTGRPAIVEFATVNPYQFQIQSIIEEMTGIQARHILRVSRDDGAYRFALRQGDTALAPFASNPRPGLRLPLFSKLQTHAQLDAALHWHRVPTTMLGAWSTRSWVTHNTQSAELANSPVALPASRPRP